MHSRFPHRVSACVATICLLFLPTWQTWAGIDASCLQLPAGAEFEPGDVLRTGAGSGIVLRAAHIPARWDPGHDGAAADSAGTMRLDLFAGYVDARTGEPRTSTMIRGIEVRYSLSGAAGTIATGTFEPRLTSDGPSYGADLPIPSGETVLGLALDLDDPAAPGPETDHEPGPDHGDEGCPRVPAHVNFLIDIEEAVAAYSSGQAAPDAPGDDRNVTLLGSLDPRAPDDYNDVWGYDDGTTFLAILGGQNGTSFIDVTDPTNPIEVGFVSGPSSSWRDIKTYGTRAYIVTEGTGSGTGLQVVDLADPLNPTLAATLDTEFTSAHNIWIDVPAGLAWVVGTGPGTHVLDLAADPVDPPEILLWTDRYVHDAYVADGLAYFSEINDGIHEILDASDPASGLTVLSSWPTPNEDTHNSWANDDHTVLAATDETSGGGYVSVWDITDKNVPAPLESEYVPNPSSIVHNVKFDDQDDELLAMSHYALGLKVVDLHRPTRPVEWGSYDTYTAGDAGFNGAWGVYAFDPRGYYYVSDIQTGLYVLELDPAGGTLSGVVRDASTLDPIPGARVVDLDDGAELRTDDDGVYAVYAEGETPLRVDAWGYRTVTVRPGSVPPSGRLDVDLDLEPLPRVPLSGTVTSSADGLPVAGLSVRIAGSPLATVTGGDGGFSFPETAIGQQTVTVDGFGYGPAEGTVVIERGSPATLDLVVTPAAFVDDVEADLGWTAGVPGDGATTGIWERGEPNPTGGGEIQPDLDATPDPGTDAYVTGNQPNAGTESDDVEGGSTTLLSPAIDASAFGAAVVRYQRWFSDAGGFFDGGSMQVEISPDGGSNWTTLETVSSNANRWQGRSFDVGSRTSITDSMRVRFVAVPVSGFENYRVLEAAIDDVELVSACVARFNPDAADTDRDGTVDGCDPCPLDAGDDADDDGVCGDVDNAPSTANPDQADGDGDGTGDVVDNCVSTANPDQRDLDADGTGDACDDDRDGDGIDDASDPDDDGDGVDDGTDTCAGVPDAAQRDRDGDGEGDACDPDDGEVHGLRVDGSAVEWEEETGSEAYHLYRGDLGDPALLPLAACRVGSLGGLRYVDSDLPRPGDGYFYLVTRVSGGVEGSAGRDSDGAERVIREPCP